MGQLILHAAATLARKVSWRVAVYSIIVSLTELNFLCYADTLLWFGPIGSVLVALENYEHVQKVSPRNLSKPFD